MTRALVISSAAAVIATLAGTQLIPLLKRLGVAKEISDEGADSPHVKSGTPTMGGLLILGTIASLGRKRSFAWLTIKIIVLGGICVWAVGSKGYHIGASGLVFGYFGYAVARAWTQRTFLTLILALGTIFLFSGILYGVVPNDERAVSWEAHLFGLIAGILWALTEGKEPKQVSDPT